MLGPMAAEKPWWRQAPTPAPSVTPSPSVGPTPLADLADGESTTMQGSGREPYVLKNTGGVYSCSCPAWRNAGGAIDTRSCKHLRKLRGDAAEDHRLARGGVARAARASQDTVRGEGAAPPVLLAHTWDNVTDLSSWWMSEKLDGVRAYWDGKRFLSRLGNELFAPEWFVEGLPEHPLDGELWGGRKLFQRTVSTVRRQDRGEAWREIRYVAFDLPHLREPFEARLDALAGIVARVGKAHVEAHAQSRCESLEALREELRRVEALGGEGLMMRRPGSLYEIGRSHTLLKVKSFHDAEARVVGHLPGAGKHKGRLGALECEMPDGTRFSVGTGLSDDERRSPPPIGAIVTYRYQELSNDGVPRFPSYVGTRDDVAFPERAARPAPARAAVSANAREAPADTPPFRRFASGGTSWEIALDGKTHTIRRLVGSALETTRTAFSDATAAWRDAEARVAAKVGEGFVEVREE